MFKKLENKLENKLEKLVETEQKLLGVFDDVSYIEETMPSDFIKNQKAVDEYWKIFKEKNPHSTRDPKLRINRLEFKENQLKVFLSEGIDFADIVYNNWKYTSKKIPRTPEETYEKISPSIWKTKSEFPNAASIGAIIVFREKNPKIIFNLRSKKVFGDINMISIPVNGYVDPIKKSKDLLLDNLYKETKEETGLSKNEIKNISFVGPAQMRGRGCDFIWLIQPNIDYEKWLNREKRHILSNKESSELISYELSEVSNLFSKEKKATLNPLITSLESIIKNIS